MSATWWPFFLNFNVSSNPIYYTDQGITFYCHQCHSKKYRCDDDYWFDLISVRYKQVLVNNLCTVLSATLSLREKLMSIKNDFAIAMQNIWSWFVCTPKQYSNQHLFSNTLWAPWPLECISSLWVILGHMHFIFSIIFRSSEGVGSWNSSFMMTPSNWNIFRVTGPLCGEFTSHRWIPSQRPGTPSFDVFFGLRLNKRLSKQSGGW